MAPDAPEASFPALVRSRPQRWASVLAAALLLAIGLLPQFGGPGYEAAFAAGLILPSIAAVTAALEVSRSRVPPRQALARGAASGCWLGFLGFLVTLIHGARVGFCDPSEGIVLYALGPGFGAVLGGVGGSFAGLISARFPQPRKRWMASVALGLLGPIGGVAVSLWRFYSSPMVFAFDPFFGYFSGPLYDTVIDPAWTLFTYRVGTALSLLCFVILAEHLVWNPAGQLRLVRPTRLGLAALGLASAALSVAHIAYGPELGHYSTVHSIEKALGRKLVGKRCEVVYSTSILERDVAWFTRDCDAHVPVIERFFGTKGPEKIRVYLFLNDGEKGRLMGASRTYVAKPWREEVYVQAAPFPHPVIGHELAHVIAGSFGAGPFRVSGPLGGLIPDPGRIEGVAVAAAPEEDEELSRTEWSAAMLELKLLPPLKNLFRLSFLGEPSSRAYTVAGAFVSFFAERYGMEKLRAWYGGQRLEEVTGGKTLNDLDREFRLSLARIELPKQALDTARARFDRPSFFARKCPRIVDRLFGEAEQRLAMGDWKEARERYLDVLRLDPHHKNSRFGLASCARKQGDEAAAIQRYLELSKNSELTQVDHANAFEAAGDLDFAAGRVAASSELYTKAEALLLDEGRLRTLDVKRWADAGLRHEAIDALLVGDAEFGSSWDVAAPLIGKLAEQPGEEDVANYLLGRNLMLRGRFREAETYLDRSLAQPPTLPRVRREALRNRLLVAGALQEFEKGAEVLALLLEGPGLTAAEREGIRRFAARSGIAEPQVKSPAPTPP